MHFSKVAISYHRNGICGNGFHVVRFGWYDADEKAHRTMVATVFAEPGNCAVLDLDETARGNIAFAKGNSWRGDEFEPTLRELIAAWQQ